MVDWDEFRRWREEAGRALESAQLQASAGIDNWSCFLAEQAAQLAVKALLHGLGRGAWGHDVVRLGLAAREVLGDDWPAELDGALRRLSRHYIPARYPDAHPSGAPGSHYGPEDAADALGAARAVIAAVDSLWERAAKAAEGRPQESR